MISRPLRIVLSLLATAVVTVLLVPRNAKFSYEYKKGQAWKYDNLYASFDFPIIKTEEQMLEERANVSREQIPYYKYSSELVNKNLKLAEGLELGQYKSAVISDMRSIYEKGIIGDDVAPEDGIDVIYIQRDKRAVKHPATDVYRLSNARAKLLADMVSLSGLGAMDSLLREQGVYDLLAPNLIYDSQTTNLVHSQSVKAISPTVGFISAGELLISKGEIVTSEVKQILDSYASEYESNMGFASSRLAFWGGNILLVLAIVALMFFMILFTDSGIFDDSRFFYLLLVMALASATALVMMRVDETLLFLVPFTLTALYLQAFFKAKVIVPVYFVSLLPLLVYSHNGVALYTMFIVSGVVSIFLFKRFYRGWRQFVSAAVNFVVLALVFFAFYMLDMVSVNPFRALIYLFISSMLIVAGYPLVYLFEKVFNLVSKSRLSELCDTSSPLLRELEMKAPGTFQHSLQVMNVAEAAARSIDANSVLVRAGALYHDIGKLNNPLCFVENESLVARAEDEKYHSSLAPEQSAQDIMRHVTDGVEIARKYRLPEPIVDFISSHHGTTLVSYFYNRHLNAGGSASAEQEFRYPGRTPKTKEEIILMLSDSIEAASRTLKDYSAESISNFVEGIVKGKMDQGQFEDADITIRELSAIRASLKQYLAQMHHQRVVYPERNKSRKKQ